MGSSLGDWARLPEDGASIAYKNKSLRSTYVETRPSCNQRVNSQVPNGHHYILSSRIHDTALKLPVVSDPLYPINLLYTPLITSLLYCRYNRFNTYLTNPTPPCFERPK